MGTSKKSIKQNTQEWRELRVGRITASNAGAILGLDPWRTADDVLRQMVREYHNAPNEQGTNPAMEWGKSMEDIAANTLEHLVNTKLEPGGFYECEDWLGASPDRHCGPDIVEIKSPYKFRNTEAPVPFVSIFDPSQAHYYAQVQVQLICSKARMCYFYQWAPEGDMLEAVTPDPEWIEDNVPKLKAFYELYLSELYNKAHLEPKVKKAGAYNTTKLVDEYDSLSDDIKALEARKKEIIEELRTIVKDTPSEINGRKFYPTERKSVKYAEVVKKHLPELDLEPYTTTSVTWGLAPRKKEKEEK